MPFEPIAIIGQSCVLPGALTPGQLWDAVRQGRDLVTGAPEGLWRIRRELVMAASPEDSEDLTWTDRGGYVDAAAFDGVFEPGAFALPAGEVAQLDPLFHWVLHAAREALVDAAWDRERGAAGAVLGNLSYPSTSLSRLAESVWLDNLGQHELEGQARELAGVARPDPINRYMSGLPAHLLAEALGLDAGCASFVLDAACSSSLYAVKLACDRLHDRRADVMLAGGVNRADDLFLHIGFCALQAMSRSGRSRPFHRRADGLLPASGAAFVVLRRLEDAIASGDRILGVIRAVGLSNDGRGRGMLVPDEEGQVRAMEQAYAMSGGLTPGDVSMVECHATGTVLGDGVELRSMGRVFQGQDGVPIGSLKSNMGHLITASGVAGLIKVLASMEAEERPRTLHAEEPMAELKGSPFRLLHDNEPWPSQRPRVAAVNNFGFGGNNAHLLVEQYGERGARSAERGAAGQAEPVLSVEGERSETASAAQAEFDPQSPTMPGSDIPRSELRVPSSRVAIVGVEVLAADCAHRGDFARALFAGEPRLREGADGELAGRADSVTLPIKGLRFPPADLDQALAQQLFVLRAGLDLSRRIGPLPRERTGVMVGMQADAEVGRYGARWRVAQWAGDWADALERDLDEEWLNRARDLMGSARTSAGVVGAMPNIPANRLCAQLDLAGPSFTVSAEEGSGLVCLELAARALRHGELDAVLVGAVDMCCEPVNAAAAREVLPEHLHTPGDAAVMLALKRLDDARRDDDEVFALLETDPAGEPGLRLGAGDGRQDLTPLFGHAHAASGLLHVAAAALACRHRASPASGGDGPMPWLPSDGTDVSVSVSPLRGRPMEVCLCEDDEAAPAPLLLAGRPRVDVYSGRDAAQVLDRMRRERPGDQGPARLVLVASGDEEMRQRREHAEGILQGEERRPVPGVHFQAAPVEGELAFVFTGPAGSYGGMGRDLLLALPELRRRAFARSRSLGEATGWVYRPGAGDDAPPHAKLWGSAFLSLIHTELSRGVLGLKPASVLGFCAGETNSLFAMEAWRDLDAMYHQFNGMATFTHMVGGDYALLDRAWEEHDLAPEERRWVNWRVLASEEDVRAAVDDEPLAYITVISAPDDLVIGGQPAACRRVVQRVGISRAVPLGYDIISHSPEIQHYADPWWRLHHRPTHEVPGVRFYTSSTYSSYEPTRDAAADALLGMAQQTFDFPRLVQAAYDDGARIFVEHGPRDGCTKWIRRILGDRQGEYLAVPLDRGGQAAVSQAVDAAARLLAAGVPVDLDALLGRLDRAAETLGPPPADEGPTRIYPAHPPGVELPPLPRERPLEYQLMPPAPALPPVSMPVEPEVPLRGGAGAQVREIRPPAVRAPAGGQELLRLALEHHQRVAGVHQHYLAQQARAHQAFLQQRSHSQAGILGAYRASGDQRAPRIELPAIAELPPTLMRTPTEPSAVEIVTEPPAPPPTEGPTGPTFDRQDLMVHASGNISEIFGAQFQQQDVHTRQVRMPEPPLLLADRVTGIRGEPGTMGKGTIWTETDIHWDSWYLNEGVMPAGIVVESGQADLMLISWLGVDFLNKGERVYRLLGCELTYHGTPPRAGETLCYEITVDSHASVGPVRLFFFHYDCRVNGELRLSVRNAQAGFFTDQELAESGGVLWDAETGEHSDDGPLDAPLVACERRSFDAAEVEAFSRGDVWGCFGPGFEMARTHVRTPKIQGGKMLLLQRVAELDPTGGPWGRGYLRVENDLSPDDWYLQGHFKNDPCMPGTLMCDGCLQAMAFYLTALGYTLARDGWRFDPVPEESYHLRCRGQVTPSSKKLTYEVFVEEVCDGPVPYIYADILGSSDGLKIFHGRRMGLRLVPDWPMSSRPELLAEYVEPKPVARTPDGFTFDYASLLACAWGRPSDAFGELGRPFDGTRNIARLPGPPYHFMSRVTRVDGAMGEVKAGASIELEYDVPDDAWYFRENVAGSMPFCVALEAALQPCGWLAVYIGCPGVSAKDLHFRNLDGTGTLHMEVLPEHGTILTRTKLTSVSRTGDMILVSFELESTVDGQPLYTLKTGFGFFPSEALAQQIGIPASKEERAWLDRPSEFDLDLTERPTRYFQGAPALPGPMLLMLDRVTGYWPNEGEAGLGRLRAVKDVDPGEWFFKAHFYRDPVQPGSLGIEAMIQLLQFYMLERDMHQGIASPRFECLATGRPMTWRYRGQVTPQRDQVTAEVEITEIGRDERGPFAVARAWLWVDGLRIYSATDLGMRIVSQTPLPLPLPSSPEPLPSPEPDPTDPDEITLDPDVDTWLGDHRPNYTLPTLPLMVMADRMALAAAHRYPDQVVVGLRDLRVKGWLTFDGPRRLRTKVVKEPPRAGAPVEVALQVWRDASRATLSRFETVATGLVQLRKKHPPRPARLPALTDAESMPDPYAQGALFHGPALHVLRDLRAGGAGYSAYLDATPGELPAGLLNPRLLDGLIHGILPELLGRWSPRIKGHVLPYPLKVDWASFHGPAPTSGTVRCEVRFAGFDGDERFPAFRVQLCADDEVWAELRLVEVLIPMGRHGHHRDRQINFLRDHKFMPGVGLSRFAGEETRLREAEVLEREWLKGSVAYCYKVDGDLSQMTRQAVIKDHVAQRSGVHPSAVEVGDDGATATCEALPLTRFHVSVTEDGDELVARDERPAALDLAPVRAYGRRAMGAGGWLGEELTLGLCQQFVRRLILQDPAAWDRIHGRSAIYLGNHQTQVESMMLPVLASALSTVHIVTIARVQHRTGWIGKLHKLSHSHPGIEYPREIIYFDQQDRASMLGIMEDLRQKMTRERHSMFVHVEGQLGLRCGQPVERMSSVFADLAQALAVPVVPVRFAGGLPVEELDHTLDFPHRYCKQDIYLGRPIFPDELAALPYAERRRHLLDAINTLGPPLSEERPNAPDEELRRAVAGLQARLEIPEVQAVLLAVLARLEDPTTEGEVLLAGLRRNKMVVMDDSVGHWLADLARWLFGPHGPTIRVREIPKKRKKKPKR